MHEIDQAERRLRRGMAFGLLLALPFWTICWMVAAWLWSR